MPSARTLLITGGAWWAPSSPVNIGHHAIRELLRTATRPYRLYICTRNTPLPSAFTDYLASLPSSAPCSQGSSGSPIAHSLHHIPLDLASPHSIKSCARAFLAAEPGGLDVLVLNAGMVPASYEPAVTLKLSPPTGSGTDEVEEELERTMMVNVLGHALLVEYLWDALLRKGQHPSSDTAETRPRIVTVGSELHRRIGQRVTPENLDSLIGASAVQWQSMMAYKVSKLVETHLSFILQDRLGRDGVSLAVSPGFIPTTSLSRTSSWPARLAMQYILPWFPFARTVEEGGRRVVDAITRNDVEGDAENQTGYLKEFEFAPAADDCYDLALRAQWREYIRERVQALQQVA